MKKQKHRILSAFLCFLMTFITLSGTYIPANAVEIVPVPETISLNTTNATEEETPEETPEETEVQGDNTQKITLSFYDSDGTTLLLSVPMEYNGTELHLDEYLSDISDISMTRNGYTVKKWYCITNKKHYSIDGLYSRLNIKKDYDFKAIWNKTPYEFTIEYNKNGGFFPDDISDLPETFTVESDTITLPKPQRKKYTFGGWYTDKNFKKRITKIKTGTYIDSDENGEIAPLTLYAKWTPSKPGTVKKPSAKNSSTGKINVTFKKLSKVSGYEITYATDKKFKSNKITKDLGKKNSLTLTNLPQGKTYYFKVRAYKKDSTGTACYGKYSSIRSCKIKKGVKEYPAEKNSGKLKKVIVKDKTDLYVAATVSQRLKSSDDFYYLVKVDPNTNKVMKQIAKTNKTTTVKFRIPLKDENGTNHIQGKYGIAVKSGKKYKLITKTAYISNPEAAADYTDAFPVPTSKKGRQGRYNIYTGDKNYFVNFCLNTIIGTKDSYNVKYKYNGKTYYFYYPNFGAISQVNADGGTATVQIMLEYDEKCKDLILPSGRAPYYANYYAFNTEDRAAREKIEAAFQFITEHASKENYHVDNWILGNEVNTYANTYARWYYAGNISRDKFMKNYASTFRMLYYAVKSNNKNGRVYICCDHTWVDRDNDWGTRYFTEAFNKEIKKQNKKIQWNLAYHAYSAVLTNADFWNDGDLAKNELSTDFVSPKNLEIMTNYIKENFGKDCRIILSEQGFSCSGGYGSPYNNNRQTGQGVQAAATAYLYYKAEFNDMIDAVIFCSGDHGGAGFQFDFIGRKAEKVYKYMDTPKYSKYVNKYLKTIGASSWKKIVPGFNEKKLKKMPNR